MENLTDQVIKDLNRDELLQSLYDTEVEIFSIKFSLTHYDVEEGSEVHQYMVNKLKELEHLSNRLMDEVSNRSKD
jgi:hypothetical protein